MSVEASLKGFRFLVSGFRFKPELGARNHEAIEGKYMNKTFRIRIGFSCSDNREPETCTEPCRKIENLKWLGLLVLLFGWVGMAQAQQPTKIPRIGYLSLGSSITATTRYEAFRQGLRELGYVEGKNIVTEWRAADGKLDRLPALAAELVRLKVEVIVAAASSVTLAAKEATTTIPIVIAQEGDPVGTGLVASLARPGGQPYWIINPRRGAIRKTTGASEGDCS